MSGHNLRIFGLIESKIAQLEAMKVANFERERQGHAYAYDEAAFQEVADELERLANSTENGSSE